MCISRIFAHSSATIGMEMLNTYSVLSNKTPKMMMKCFWYPVSYDFNIISIPLPRPLESVSFISSFSWSIPKLRPWLRTAL